MFQKRIFCGLWMLLAVFFMVPHCVYGDIYWESEQSVQGGDGKPRKKTIRNYYTSDCSRMDIGENVMIANFKTMTGYVLNTEDRMFMEMKMNAVGKIPEGLNEEIQVTPTSETRNIAGYNCRKYKVSFMERQYEEWLSKDVKGYDELKTINDRLNDVVRKNPLFQMGIVGKMDKLDGFPVQTVMRMEGGLTKTVTLRRVATSPIDESVFTVPAGYKPPY
ncbi:MAG: DUF4412 domain-containing protein [Desulfococcaceae bacterium]